MFKIGIDLGGTNIKVGLVNKDQQIVYSKSILTHTQRSYQEIVGDMVELVKEVCHDYGIEIAQLEAIGIGCPGLIDATHGTVPYSNNLGWKDVPLIEEFEKHFTCRIKVSNDANCAALGEVVAGAAKDVANAVFLTLGTGDRKSVV